MKTLTILSARPLVLGAGLALVVVGCKGSQDSGQGDTTMAAAQNSQTQNSQAQTQAPSAQAGSAQEPILVRGTVSSVSADQLAIKADTGTVAVKVTQPFHVYEQARGKLADVKDSTFIGVTTVKQADGSERATEIHVFPEALRGLGEGSRMMAPRPSAAASRMTNGSVSAPPSRMSNGSVSNSNGSTFVVRYSGGSQTVTVPPNTPVTEIKGTPKVLAVGDTVIVLATKAADGSLTSDKALAAGK